MKLLLIVFYMNTAPLLWEVWGRGRVVSWKMMGRDWRGDLAEQFVVNFKHLILGNEIIDLMFKRNSENRTRKVSQFLRNHVTKNLILTFFNFFWENCWLFLKAFVNSFKNFCWIILLGGIFFLDFFPCLSDDLAPYWTCFDFCLSFL